MGKKHSGRDHNSLTSIGTSPRTHFLHLQPQKLQSFTYLLILVHWDQRPPCEACLYYITWEVLSVIMAFYGLLSLSSYIRFV